ncbi:MAG: hypothetical protein WCT10_00620 [Patescibacteria group bacterium]|jgi:hypothetical protein
MLQFRTTSSPFKERTVFKTVEFELLALGELRKAGFLPSSPEPIRIEAFIVKRFGVTPDYCAELPDGILGLTTFGSNGPTDIMISKELGEDTSDVGRRRTNATLAHEAGHCLLHAYLFAISGRKGGALLGRSTNAPAAVAGIDLSDPRFLCRDIGTNAAGGYRWWEWQADAMIGPLLMPRPLVDSLLRAEFQLAAPSPKSGQTSLEGSVAIVAAKRLSDVFDVNPVVARIRLEKLGFSISRS